MTEKRIPSLTEKMLPTYMGIMNLILIVIYFGSRLDEE